MAGGKREVFVWKEWHEKVLLAEIALIEPYKYKFGTKERGAAWKEIADTLNAKEGFKVSHRSVREKFDKMMKDFNKKENEEEKASGVEVEYTEIHRALEDIKGRMAEVEELQDNEKAKENREKGVAERMRQKAMESLGSSRKKSKDGTDDQGSEVDDEEDEEVVTPRRKKSRSSGMSEVLSEAMNLKKQSNETRDKELEARKEEMKQQQAFQQSLLQQQQVFQQHQQAMNMAMLNAMAELVKKIK